MGAHRQVCIRGDDHGLSVNIIRAALSYGHMKQTNHVYQGVSGSSANRLQNFISSSRFYHMNLDKWGVSVYYTISKMV